MAWKQVGNLRGPQGPAGPAGPSGSAAPYYGVLRWSGAKFHPPANTYTRLSSVKNAKLKAHKNKGDVASAGGDFPYLWIPVAGVWLLSATQTWGNAMAAKGCGLGRQAGSGDDMMELWATFQGTNFGTVSRATFIEEGVALYPWTWSSSNADMSPNYNGLESEYSAVLLQPA